ncbi:MAG: alpha/beta hydrolase fold domain-containing protein [Pyrinomonadaceae bacterium]
MNYLSFISLFCGGVAFAFLIWIVVPAPHYRLFEVAVAAGEWSLYFGALGLAGAALGLLAVARGGGVHVPAWLAVGLGTMALALSLVPPLSARGVARDHSLKLSLREYIGSGDAESATQGLIERTISFAQHGDTRLDLDVYRAGGGQHRPAIIVVHGGAWSGGDKGDYPRWNRWLARQGFVVFDVQYRLAQPNWQTATGDVKCAVGWVRQHADEFGVDPARLALLGRSAGGHLALLAAYTARAPELPPSCDAPDTSVRAVVSLYGATDLLWGYRHPANQRVLDGPGKIRGFLGGTPETAGDRFRLLSPVAQVASDSPPTLLIHGGRDQLVGPEHTARLTQRLVEFGVPHRALLVPYAQHAFDYNFNGWGSQLTRAVLLDFLRRHLRDGAQTALVG